MSSSIMAKEAAESAAVIEQQLTKNADICAQLGETLRQQQPNFVYIIGRGSSDHAGVFAKYLIEVEMGIAVSPAAPSVTGIYGRQLNLNGALALVISQSGRSPDILKQAQMAKDNGAYLVALVNDETSPLAQMADVYIPLRANKEQAVAATKSYLATLSAILQMVAYWKQDTDLLQALPQLPAQLLKAQQAQPQLSADFTRGLAHCVVLGRGYGYAISREIALKMKEVCGIHAEAFSSAEFLHGPVTLVGNKLAIIDVAIADESLNAHQAQIDEVEQRGGVICHLDQILLDVHPRLAPLLLLQRFYLDIEQIAVHMGRDPDNPQGLKKVTQTF